MKTLISKYMVRYATTVSHFIIKLYYDFATYAVFMVVGMKRGLVGYPITVMVYKNIEI